MHSLSRPELVTVFGGSGFVGRHVVKALAQRGYRIRVAVRRPDLAHYLQPLGNVGQIAAVQANLRYRDSVEAAVAGADHVVNCVGVLFETGRNTFTAVHEQGARFIAEAARSAGASFTHVSAIGADPESPSDYFASKGRAEGSISQITPDAVILRPSIIFGPEDTFFNKFAAMARISPVLPLVGGGHTRLQLVYAGDVAEMAARSVAGTLVPGTIYELGGPHTSSFREWMEEMLKVIQRKRAFVPLPWGIASLIGAVAGLVPFIEPPLTTDQVAMLKVDNVVSDAAEKEGRTLSGVGIRPVSTEAILPTYLVSYREQGQYTGAGNKA